MEGRAFYQSIVTDTANSSTNGLSLARRIALEAFKPVQEQKDCVLVLLSLAVVLDQYRRLPSLQVMYMCVNRMLPRELHREPHL